MRAYAEANAPLRSGESSTFAALVSTGFLVLVLSACTPTPDMPSHVARVGSATLTEEEIGEMLQNSSAFLDSADAVSQIVEQWVTNELLYQEAVDRGLKGDPDVQRLLSDNERSVLINALVSRFLDDEMGGGPDESAIQTYYEQHREKLALREPFVRIRHLIYENPDSADAARSALLESMLTPDFPDGGRTMGGINEEAFYPESQMFAATPGLGEAIRGMDVGDVHPVFVVDSTYHVVQLMDRLDVGTVPTLDMVRGEIRDRVAIEMRKQLFARQVQRLRTRALAREELEVK